MAKLTGITLALVLSTGSAFAGPNSAKASKSQKTFTGEISDSMCGMKHMMEGGPKECALKCVDGGSKFVLADAVHNQVYQLTDQDKAKPYAGDKVKVTGTLKGDTIEVSSIQPAK